MFYRLDGYIVDTFVSYLRRVFRYNSQWTNKALEIVQLTSGSIDLAFEQFFEENEKYPIITVAAAGGTFDPIAFNDFIDTADDDSVAFGTRMQAAVMIDSSNLLAIQVPPGAQNETVRALSVTMAAQSYAQSGDNIAINLYSGYQTSPVLVASGSMAGSNDTTFNPYYCEFSPFLLLNGADYWVTLQPASGSQYQVGIDQTVDTMYNFAGAGNVTGSVNGFLLLPAFVRYGSNLEGSVQIRCMAKNSTKEVYKLSELIVQYFTLAKHAQLSRGSGATDGMVAQVLDASAVAEFVNKDIAIRGIRVGGVENRRRGDNDVIFTINVTVDTFSEWHQDYLAQPFKDVTTDIRSFS